MGRRVRAREGCHGRVGREEVETPRASFCNDYIRIVSCASSSFDAFSSPRSHKVAKLLALASPTRLQSSASSLASSAANRRRDKSQTVKLIHGGSSPPRGVRIERRSVRAKVHRRGIASEVLRRITALTASLLTAPSLL